MGTDIFDGWSILHFIFGFLSTSALIPTNPYLSAIITNIIHLFVELIEKDKIPYTNELVESNINHTTDVIFFFIGSILAVKYGNKFFIKNQTLRYFVLVIMFLAFLQETLRELFPDTWIIGPAYQGKNKKIA
jgi:hypothetical protein